MVFLRHSTSSRRQGQRKKERKKEGNQNDSQHLLYLCFVLFYNHCRVATDNDIVRESPAHHASCSNHHIIAKCRPLQDNAVSTDETALAYLNGSFLHLVKLFLGMPLAIRKRMKVVVDNFAPRANVRVLTNRNGVHGIKRTTAHTDPFVNLYLSSIFRHNNTAMRQSYHVTQGVRKDVDFPPPSLLKHIDELGKA